MSKDLFFCYENGTCPDFHCALKTVNDNMSRMYYTKVNFPT